MLQPTLQRRILMIIYKPFERTRLDYDVIYDKLYTLSTNKIEQICLH